jgi:hypothetical protein
LAPLRISGDIKYFFEVTPYPMEGSSASSVMCRGLLPRGYLFYLLLAIKKLCFFISLKARWSFTITVLGTPEAAGGGLLFGSYFVRAAFLDALEYRLSCL